MKNFKEYKAKKLNALRKQAVRNKVFNDRVGSVMPPYALDIFRFHFPEVKKSYLKSMMMECSDVWSEDLYDLMYAFFKGNADIEKRYEEQMK